MARDYKTPQELAQRFKAVGIEVVRVVEGDAQFDPELELREGYTLQLGDDLYVLGRFEDGSLDVVVQTKSLQRVVSEILRKFPVPFQKPTQEPTQYMLEKAREMTVTESQFVAMFRRGYRTAARKAYRQARAN